MRNHRKQRHRQVNAIINNGRQDGLCRRHGGMRQPPYLIPQHFGQYDSMTVAEALGVAEKLAAMKQDLNAAQTELHKLPEMKLDIGNPTMPANKLLVETTDVTFGYPGREPLWQRSPLSISLYSGERV